MGGRGLIAYHWWDGWGIISQQRGIYFLDGGLLAVLVWCRVVSAQKKRSLFVCLFVARTLPYPTLTSARKYDVEQ